MARKKKHSPLEDLIDITALLPWWAGVLLALISYILLHHFATAVIAQPTTAAQLGANVTSQLLKALATIGQYLLPLVLIIGAGLSAYKRKTRNSLFERTSESNAVQALNAMSWQQFEILVGEAFRRGGYAVEESGGGGADGGVDLILRKDGEKYLVQCKQWRAYSIGVGIIRELYGVMAATGAAGGFVVTSGTYTQDAKEFASGRNIDLIDGVELNAIIQQLRSTDLSRVMKAVSARQICPKCGSEMVKRAAKQGVNAGKMFWGCSNFPQCRGIVQID